MCVRVHLGHDDFQQNLSTIKRLLHRSVILSLCMCIAKVGGVCRVVHFHCINSSLKLTKH